MNGPDDKHNMPDIVISESYYFFIQTLIDDHKKIDWIILGVIPCSYQRESSFANSFIELKMVSYSERRMIHIVPPAKCAV
jgi:hypothetical protein